MTKRIVQGKGALEVERETYAHLGDISPERLKEIQWYEREMHALQCRINLLAWDISHGTRN